MVLVTKMLNKCLKQNEMPTDDEMFWMWTEIAFELFLFDIIFLGNLLGTPLLRLPF